MRSIGELCRDVMDRLEDEMATRGSFEPREFAVVLNDFGPVRGAGFFGRVEVAEEVTPFVGREPRPVSPPVAIDALAERIWATLVPYIFGVVSRSQVDQPVVCRVAVDVVHDFRHRLAVRPEPCEAVAEIVLSPKGDDQVAASVGPADDGARLYRTHLHFLGKDARVGIIADVVEDFGRDGHS